MAAAAGPTGSGRKQRAHQLGIHGKTSSRRSTENFPFRGGRAHPEPVKGGTDRHKRPCRIARPRQGVVPRNEDWQCPPTATAATGQKKHVRAAGLTRRGATQRDFAYLHFMRPKRPGRACFAETAAIGRTARRSVPTSNSTNQDAQGAKRTHKIRYVEVPTGFGRAGRAVRHGARNYDRASAREAMSDRESNASEGG